MARLLETSLPFVRLGWETVHGSSSLVSSSHHLQFYSKTMWEGLAQAAGNSVSSAWLTGKTLERSLR